MTNSRPAFRKDDTGIHAACCNTNTWKATQGSGTVFINSKEAVRLGDQTKHCGGSGTMIEGSDNVMIGGAAGSGGGGGSGGGSSSGQGGAGTDGGVGNQTGTNSNQSGSGGGGGSSAAGGGGGPGGGGSAAAGGAASPSANPMTANPTKDPEKDVFALWLDLVAINGGKLVDEIIHIIDPDTKEIVATKKVEEDGKVFVEVPKNKAYHVDIEPRHADKYVPPKGDESSIGDHLALNLYDEDGMALPAGVDVKIKGDSETLTVKTSLGGHVSVAMKPGTYELTILGQTFVAETLSSQELNHPDAKAYEFQVNTEDKK
jgi:hypothetical protein